MLAVGYAFPQLRGADYSISDPEYWLRQLEEMAELHAEYSGVSRKGPEEQARFRREMLLRILRGYPLAKRALVEGGMNPEEVEAMAVGQVVLLYAARQFDEFRGEFLKSTALPHWETLPQMREMEARISEGRRRWEEVLPLSEEYFPALTSAETAFARLDRRFALLRVFEALRLYGAEHEGRLPARLDDLSVPVPIDAVTGAAFTYRVEGAVAHVEGPPLPGRPCRYEVRLASEDTR
jgi:hypothetical protein